MEYGGIVFTVEKIVQNRIEEISLKLTSMQQEPRPDGDGPAHPALPHGESATGDGDGNGEGSAPDAPEKGGA